MQGGLTDGPPHVYSAVQMAHEWYDAGRPIEMRSAQETRTNYDYAAMIDFDYLNCYLVRVQTGGEDTDWITYFAIFRSPGDKLVVESHPARPVKFFDHTAESAFAVIRWFTDWSEERLKEYPA